MPQERNYNQGTFTPVSGLAEHVGKPLEAYNKVGEVLQQRYWQAKQSYSALDSTIKNFPMFDKEVDQKHIDAANKLISEKMKPVIENDDFHNAQEIVTSITKSITDNKALRSISNANAKQQLFLANQEKRQEKQPNTRLAEKASLLYAKTKWREQGGAVDSDGNTQELQTWEPTTDMDMGKWKDKIAKNVEMLKAVKSFTSGQGEYNLNTQLNTLSSDEERNALRKFYTITKGFERLTPERIQEIAIATVADDPEYNAMLKDFAFTNLVNTTGKLVPDVDTIKNIVHNNSSLEKQLALQESPIYKEALTNLQHKYQNLIDNAKSPQVRQVLSKQFITEKSKLYNNEAIYNQGKDLLYKKLDIESNATNLYYDLATKDLNNTIIHSSDAKAYTSQISQDQSQINTDAFAAHALKKIDENTKNISVVIPGGSTNEKFDVSIFAPDSQDLANYNDAKAKLELVKNSNAAPAIKEQAAHQLNVLTAAHDDKIDIVMRTLGSMSPQAKQEVFSDAAFWRFGAKQHFLYTDAKATPAERAAHVAEINQKEANEKARGNYQTNAPWTSITGMYDIINTGVNRGINAISNVLGTSSSDAKVRLVMRSMPKEAVLNSTPEQLIQQYGKGVKWDNNAVELLKDRVNTFKYDILNAVAKRPEINKVKSYAEIATFGTPTIQETRNNLSVLSQVLGGNATIEDAGVSISNGNITFKDANGDEQTGRILINDPNAKEVNINDLNNVMINRVATNRASDGVQRSVVTFKVVNEKGQIISTPRLHIATSDVGSTSRDADISSLNNLSQSMAKGSNAAYVTGTHIFSEKGHTLRDDDNRPMESHEQTILQDIQNSINNNQPLHYHQFKMNNGEKTIIVTPNKDNTMTYKIVNKNGVVESGTPSGRYTAVENLHTIMGLEFDANGVKPDVRENIYNSINYKTSK